MKYFVAYVMTLLQNKVSPTAEQISLLLKSLGTEVDLRRVNKVLSQFAGKSVDKVLHSVKSELDWCSEENGSALRSMMTIVRNYEEVISDKEDEIRTLQRANEYYIQMDRFRSNGGQYSRQNVNQENRVVSASATSCHPSTLVERPALAPIQMTTSKRVATSVSSDTPERKLAKQNTSLSEFQNIFHTSREKVNSDLEVDLGTYVFMSPQESVLNYVKLEKKHLKDNQLFHQIWVGRVRDFHQGCEVIDRNLYGYTSLENCQVAAYNILIQNRLAIHNPLDVRACSTWVDFRDGKFIRIDEVFVLNLISLHKYSSKQLKFYFKKCHEGLGTIKTEKSELLVTPHKLILEAALEPYLESFGGMTRHALPQVDMEAIPKSGLPRTTDEDRTCPKCGKLFVTVYNMKRHHENDCGHRVYISRFRNEAQPRTEVSKFSSFLPQPDFNTVAARTSCSNSTVFCAPVSSIVTEENLMNEFRKFGDILNLRREENHFVFIKFSNKDSATQSIVETHNKNLFEEVVKCSWARESHFND